MNFFAITIYSLLVTSCLNEGEKTLVLIDEEKQESSWYKNFVTPEIEQSIDSLGLKVYRGSKPPVITGYFRADDYCTNSTIPNDGYVGRLINNYKIHFFDQDKLSVSMLAYQVATATDRWISTTEGAGTFVCGQGNDFTVFMEEISEEDVVTLGIYSGTLDKDANGAVRGIKDFQYALLMKDNKGLSSKINNGEGRLFEDDYVPTITQSQFEYLINYSGAPALSPVSKPAMKMDDK
ncbi:MAG: hypothetical protein LBG77_08670 [Dysgonamonadaceae bacterium]|nr:hypothetical protein [Dysgonamonadaceae bacterium]